MSELMCSQSKCRRKDEHIAELEQENTKLREALNEAMGWNWLDDDMNDEVANRLYALLQESDDAQT